MDTPNTPSIPADKPAKIDLDQLYMDMDERLMDGYLAAMKRHVAPKAEQPAHEALPPNYTDAPIEQAVHEPSNPPDSPEGHGRHNGGRAKYKISTPTARKLREQNDAKEMLIATLDHLNDNKKWGMSQTKIMTLAGISRDTYYRLKKKHEIIRRKLSDYKRNSLGRSTSKRSDQ